MTEVAWTGPRATAVGAARRIHSRVVATVTSHVQPSWFDNCDADSKFVNNRLVHVDINHFPCTEMASSCNYVDFHRESERMQSCREVGRH